MDSDAASHIMLDMFKTIKKSTFIDPDTSLWHFAYLYDQGFGTDTIHETQTQINEIMLAQLGGDFSDNHGGYERLKSALQKTRA